MDKLGRLQSAVRAYLVALDAEHKEADSGVLGRKWERLVAERNSAEQRLRLLTSPSRAKDPKP